MTAARDQLPETVAEIVNLKVLEVYRKADSLSDAKNQDMLLTDLGQRIIEALYHLPDDDPIVIHGPLLPTRDPNTPEAQREAPTSGKDTARAKENGAGSEPVGAGSAGDPETHYELTCVDCGGPRAAGSSKLCRECYIGRAEGKKPADKMSEKRPGGKQKRHPLADQLEAWLAANDISMARFAKAIGTTGQTISNLLNGATQQPSGKVTKAIRKGMESGKQPKKKPAIPERANGSHSITESVISKPAAPRGAVQFLQLQVRKYITEKGITYTGAAVDFGIDVSGLEALENGRVPSPFVIGRIAARIPEVEANRRTLFEARRRQDSGANT